LLTPYHLLHVIYRCHHAQRGRWGNLIAGQLPLSKAQRRSLTGVASERSSQSSCRSAVRVFESAMSRFTRPERWKLRQGSEATASVCCESTVCRPKTHGWSSRHRPCERRRGSHQVGQPKCLPSALVDCACGMLAVYPAPFPRIFASHPMSSPQETHGSTRGDRPHGARQRRRGHAGRCPRPASLRQRGGRQPGLEAALHFRAGKAMSSMRPTMLFT
jgi:hypothetical protein